MRRLAAGSYKNLLDWTVGGGETYGKPVAWINAYSRPDPDAGSGAHEALRTVLAYTGADIAAPACRRIQVPRTALGADGVITDAAIRDEVTTALRTLADYASPTSKPATASPLRGLPIPELAPGPRNVRGRCQGCARCAECRSDRPCLCNQNSSPNLSRRSTRSLRENSVGRNPGLQGSSTGWQPDQEDPT